MSIPAKKLEEQTVEDEDRKLKQQHATTVALVCCQ